jgi:hypothetical protein
MRFLLSILALTQFLLLPASTLYAEKTDIKGVDKDVSHNRAVVIGDPKEIFLTKKAKQQKTSKTEKRQQPETLSEFFAYLKKDFKQVGKDLKGLKGEFEKQQRHTFRDPSFSPPERPDWR